MILVIANSGDQLALEVCRQVAAGTHPVFYVDEAGLFSDTSFAIERHSRDTKGFLNVNGDRVSFDNVSGVLLRLSRTWYPSHSFSLQDQVFVYHETLAAWFHIFSSLRCTVINRFGLGWWLRDPIYPLQLKARLAELLNLEDSVSLRDLLLNGTAITRTEEPVELSSVYVVGGKLVPGRGCDEVLASSLAAQAEQLAQWRQESGIAFCRLDFRRGDGLQLQGIEVCPSLGGNFEKGVDEVALGIVEALC